MIRSTDAAARQLAFHSDRRAPKVAELSADPRVTVIGYDMEAGRQVRVEGAARLHIGDSEAMAAWGDTRAASRRNYQSNFAPGAPLSDPTLGDTLGSDDQAVGFDRFCRIVVDVARIDWLDLAPGGHRRAIHVWSGQRWDSAWAAP